MNLIQIFKIKLIKNMKLKSNGLKLNFNKIVLKFIKNINKLFMKKLK